MCVRLVTILLRIYSFGTKKINEQKTTDDGWTSFDEKSTVRKYVLPSDDKVLGGGRTHLVIFLNDEEILVCL